MNWEALGAIAELIGGLGVIATLAYLAIQIRQNTRSMRASTYQNILLTSIETRRTIAQDEGLAKLMVATRRPLGELDELARFRIRNVAVAILRTFENAHYQYTRGMIEEMLWEPWTANIEYFCRGFGVRELWPELLPLLNREFRGYVEVTLRRIEAEDAAGSSTIS